MGPGFKLAAACLASIACLLVIPLVIWPLCMRLFEHFHPEFRVDSALISSLNTTTPAELTATWDITLVATNSDDKLIVDYDVVQVWLYYGRSTEDNTFVLATTILPPFVLNPTRNQTRLSFKLATLRAYVGDDVVKNITEAGRVTNAFGLKVVSEFRLRMNGVKKTQRGTNRFFCNEVIFGFSTNNQTRSDSVTGQSKACENGDYGPKGTQPLSRLW